MEQEIEVTARAVLVKEKTTVWGSEGHTCVEWDVNPNTGRRVGAFDKDVFTKIVGILSKLLVENGTRKD